jgi:CRISPR-associated protein Cmr4
MGRAIIVGFLAETELHPGAGPGLGTIDQPVQREGGTGFPVIPGTSYKGAARGEIIGTSKSHPLITAFGTGESGAEMIAGTVAFSDIRLLLLPMRCSVSSYKWVTTPLLLERFERDARRAGYAMMPSLRRPIEVPHHDEVYAASPINNEQLYIEEMRFTSRGESTGAATIVSWIRNLLPSVPPYAELGGRLRDQLLIMNDDDFAWFCAYSLPVRPHNRLNATTKASENFWYEEYLPADTVLYALNSDRSSSGTDVVELAKELDRRRWLQLGGNETTGEGVCCVNVWKE